MLEDLAPPSRNKLCSISRQAKELSKKDQEILQEALDNPHWPHETLALDLSSKGFIVGKDVVRKHRKGMCACVR